MNTWTSGMIVVATLVAGCTGEVTEAPDGSMPAKPGGGDQRPGDPSAPGGTAGPGGTAVPGGSAAPGGPTAPGGTISPGGGTAPGNPTLPPPSCVEGVAATSQIPRLTNAQYDRTVRDLLGVTALAASNNVPPSLILATDQSGGLTDLAWSAYKSVAEQIAAQVMADPNLKSKFLKCTPAADPADNCLKQTVMQFGRKAFRRPLSPEEVQAFEAFLAKGPQITPDGTPEQVAEALLYAFLVSPSFLQRSEISETLDPTGNYVLSSHEVASRLSYMLWGSTPDDLLDQAADKNELQTPEQIAAQADRMIKDPKARDMIASFHRLYLHMGTNTRWDNTNRDPAAFPNFKKEAVPAMIEETERFFDEIVFTQGGTFQTLLTSPAAFVNSATAALYGRDPADFGTELERVDLDPVQRPGFLTRLGFLNAYSQFSRTSPILRGAFITKDVLALDIGSPPPGAEMTELPSDAEYDTNRKQVTAQTASGTCAGCHHNFINPPGFIMEAYDASGAWQTHERTSGAPIDLVVDAIIDGVPVRLTTPAELMAKIAASPGAQRGYAEKWVSYAFGRVGDPLDACTVEKLTYKVNGGAYPILNLIKDITQASSFRIRALKAE